MKTRPVRTQYLDQDYIDKLSPEEKEWLKNFNKAEYFNDHKALAKITKVTKKEKRRLDAQDNARRRDVSNRGKAVTAVIDKPDYQQTPEAYLVAKEAVESTFSNLRFKQLTVRRKMRKRR